MIRRTLVLFSIMFSVSCGGEAQYTGQLSVENNGGTNNGATNNGVANNGVANNGATNNGVANNGATNNGTTNNGASNNGPANNGVVQGLPDGAPCAESAECQGQTCLSPDDGYPGGHCTHLDCAATGVCSGDAQCAYLEGDRDQSACFARCDGETPCREEYECRDFGGVSFCLPAEPEPESRPDGAPCTHRDQCEGGVCFTEEDGFPGGHCTTVNCRDRNDCFGEDNACLQAGNPNYCIHLCDDAADCRDDYICQPVGRGQGFCAPSPTAGTVVPQPGDLPFDIVCESTFAEQNVFQGGLDRHTFDFSLPEGTTSFMIVPYSPGQQIFPASLEGPNGTLNMFEEYGFALANASLFINVTPILVPQAPQFADFVSGGDYTMTMASEEDLCFYVLPKTGEGSQVDLNIHFVGTRGINAENAQGHEGFQTALQRFDEIYGPSGVSIRNIRYQDSPPEVSSRFRILRSQEAAFQLVATSEKPGETQDEVLSINVFIIDQFAISGGSILGISAGLPGAAGFHGGRSSGLVFTASVLENPRLLGQVLAHEVGHYLGLFHTTEQGGRSFDPLDDTDQCQRQQWDNPERCPDINNLMFPFAGAAHATISEAQTSVLHANPLVK